MKTSTVYVKLIVDISERWCLLNSEQSTTEETAKDSDEIDDEFNDSDSSSVPSSNEDHYCRLICTMFLKDCFAELLLLHLNENCHLRGRTEPVKPLSMLAKLVSQMLSKFAGTLVNQISADNQYRVRIGEHWSEKLSKLLVELEHNEVVCSADFGSVLKSFVPLLSSSVLVQLLVVLLQLPEDCVENGTFSARGRLMVHVLQEIFEHLNTLQTEALTTISVKLSKILKLAPFDQTLCSCLITYTKRTPSFAANVTEGVVSSLLKAGARPSLSLLTVVAEDNEICRRMVVDWFASHKVWTREECLPVYVSTVLFVLNTCKTGWMLYYTF